MVQIGRINTLVIKRMRDYGVHLDGGDSGDILMPISDVPEGCRQGDEVEVFVYVNKEDHLRATTRRPRVTVGQMAGLRVKAITPSGAYLDWGLEKDLFVPKSEQIETMKAGRSYVVFVFLDHKTNRITASAKLDRFLSMEPPDLAEGDEVDLVVYEQSELGYKAVVNHAYRGMIYQNEVFQKLFIGQQLKGYIKKIREDYRIDLILQKPGYGGIDQISRAILKTIRDHGGRIALTDKSEPEEIYALFGVSKKNFKKAIGALYKKRLVTIDASGIRANR